MDRHSANRSRATTVPHWASIHFLIATAGWAIFSLPSTFPFAKRTIASCFDALHHLERPIDFLRGADDFSSRKPHAEPQTKQEYPCEPPAPGRIFGSVVARHTRDSDRDGSAFDCRLGRSGKRARACVLLRRAAGKRRLGNIGAAWGHNARHRLDDAIAKLPARCGGF